MNSGITITENLIIPFASSMYEKTRENRATLIRKQEIYIANYIVEKIKETASEGNYSYLIQLLDLMILIKKLWSM